MPNDVDRNEVRKLVGGGAQLIEVLPADDFESEHLPGAISLPLADLNRQTAARLARDRPLIVYCYDYQ